MKLLSRFFLLIFTLFLATTVHAGGLQLFEESVASLGNAFAGTSAAAEDANTAFYNPAGLTLLKYPEISAQITGIDVNLDASISSAQANSLVGLAFRQPPAPVRGYDSTEVGSWNFIPSLNLAFPVHKCFAFGLSVTSPFGLNTAYDTTSKAKYLAARTRLISLDFGPSIAFQIKQLSIGGGVDIQYVQIKASEKVPVGEALPFFPFGGPYEDGNFDNALHDVGYGWNVGLLYEISCATRIGLAYRSRVHHNPKGYAYIDLPRPPQSVVGNVITSVTLPDSLNFSFYHDVNPQWAVLGSVNYTHWSLLDILKLDYSGPITQDFSNVSLSLNFKDTYRVALGTNFSPCEKWKLRGGIAYDEGAVRNTNTRTFQVPDSDRYWLAFGTQYKVSRCMLIDVGYAHLFLQDSSNNQSQTIRLTNGGILNANAKGHFDAGVNEVGLQLTWVMV